MATASTMTPHYSYPTNHSSSSSGDVASTMNITTPCIDEEQHDKCTNYGQHLHNDHDEDGTINMRQYASKATGIFGSDVITEHQQYPKTYAESSSSSRAFVAPHHLPAILAPISSNCSSSDTPHTTLSDGSLPRNTIKIQNGPSTTHYTDDDNDKDDKSTWIFAAKKGKDHQHLLFSVDQSNQDLASVSHHHHQVRFLYYSFFESGGGLTTVFLNTYSYHSFLFPLVSQLLDNLPFRYTHP